MSDDLPTLHAAFGQVQGRCPACGYASLFLGAGGYVTCGSLSCPRPGAASVLLEGNEADRDAALATLARIERAVALADVPDGGDERAAGFNAAMAVVRIALAGPAGAGSTQDGAQ